MEPSSILLSRHESVQDAVLAAAAATGHAVRLVADPGELMQAWPVADVVFVGGDLAAEVAGLAPPARERVHLVGEDATELGRWSMVLGATVAVLPHGAALLTDAFAVDPQTPVIAVVGGAGGVGTSTLAVALAQAASGPALVLDADSDGGGLDLLLGLEREPGWRWPDLSRARGHLGGLRGKLPGIDHLEVLSMGRGDQVPSPAAQALPAVLDAARRGNDLVVIDAGRGRCPMGVAALPLADTVVLVTRADVRAVAAAVGMVRQLLEQRIRVPGLVLRLASGGGLPADEVSDAVGVPVWAQLPTDRAVALTGVHGGLPGKAAGRRWRRACAQVVERALS